MGDLNYTFPSRTRGCARAGTCAAWTMGEEGRKMRTCVRQAAAAVVLSLLVGSVASAPPLHAAETDWKFIDSIPLTDYTSAKRIEHLTARSKVSEVEMSNVRIARTAFMVETPEGTGPFPAVFFLHGCGGVVEDHYRSWDSWYLARGYAFVVIDSFAPRKLVEVCRSGNMLLFDARVGDVYAVLYYLAAHRHKYRVDPRRILITGFSHGGVVVLDAMQTGVWLKFMRKYKSTLRIAGGFAFYPHCRGKVRPAVYNPVIILSGAEDNGAPPKPCRNWLKQPASPISAPLELHVFSDAFHAFDYPGHDTATVSVNGWLEEYNPIAVRKSQEIIDKFLGSLDRRMAASQAAAEKNRRALSGNTLRWTLRNGRTAFQYFAPDGRAPLAVAGGRQFGDIRWRIDDDDILCRTSVRRKREVCLPVTVKHGEVVLYRPDGKVARKAVELAGNQLPKRPTAAGPASMGGENGIRGGKVRKSGGERRRN